MSNDNHRRRDQAEAAARVRQKRFFIIALLALGVALGLIANRDGIDEVIPDLWASAGSIVHLFGASDWPFG
jgi:hypothetical protein